MRAVAGKNRTFSAPSVALTEDGLLTALRSLRRPWEFWVNFHLTTSYLALRSDGQKARAYSYTVASGPRFCPISLMYH